MKLLKRKKGSIYIHVTVVTFKSCEMFTNSIYNWENYLFFKAIVRREMRPQNSPIMNMKPMNVIKITKKYFLDGDVTT